MQNKKSFYYMMTVVIVFIVLALVSYIAIVYWLGDDEAIADSQRTTYLIAMSVMTGGMLTAFFGSIKKKDNALEEKPTNEYYPLISGLVAGLTLIVTYIYFGMFPVGNKTIMVVDMYHQYAPLLLGLKNNILSGSSLLYSFEVGIGTSYLPLFAYYLASPFNLFLLFVPLSSFAEGILAVVTFKLMFSAALFALCMQYLFKKRDSSVIIASLMYALMSYVLAYSWNVMWLDCFMLLPLVVMGLERLLKEGKYKLYILSLGYALFSNYYIAFMLAIFLFLYFIAYLVKEKTTLKEDFVSLKRFAIGSALGVCLAAAVVLPTYFSLGKTSAATNTLPDMASNFTFIELLMRSLYQASPTIRSGNLPNVYCGILAVIAVPIFATMKSIPLRRRIAHMGLWAVLAASLVLNQLNLVWHGLHSPNDLPYRFSFIYSFVLLLITYEVISRIREITIKQIGITCTGVLAFIFIVERDSALGLTFAGIYVSALLVIIYAVILAVAAAKRIRPATAYSLLLLVVFYELVFNANVVNEQFFDKERHSLHQNYFDNDTIAAADAVAQEMKSYVGDDEFYRMEFLPRKTLADGAAFDFPGITLFSSSMAEEEAKLLDSLGYETNGINSHTYRSFNPVSDSLMGVKYIAYKRGETELSNVGPLLEFVSSITVGTVTYDVYKNECALPLAYFSASSLKNFSYVRYNPVSTIRTLINTLTGESSDVYNQYAISSASSFATINSDTSFTIQGANTVDFAANVAAGAQLCVYIDCRAASTISLNYGKGAVSVAAGKPYMINAGEVSSGTGVTVTITTDSTASGNVFILGINNEVYQNKLNTLKAGGLRISEMSDSHIIGKINAPSNGAVFSTIPYDDGWTVKVDGKKVETYVGANAMLCFDINAGDHDVEFSFTPKGFVFGVILSILALIALIYIFLRDRYIAGKRIPKFLENTMIMLPPSNAGTEDNVSLE